LKTLLIVAHDDGTRDHLLEMLRVNKDWRTLVVADAAALLKAICVFIPHLVILDLAVDHADGLEAYRLLRDHPFGADVPVLFISGGIVKAEAARLTGIYASLETPVYHAVLTEHVTALLAATGSGDRRVATT
jgi:DNA-binding response OmpR family regulator